MYEGTKRQEQKQLWKTAKEDQEEEAKRRRKQRMLLKRQFLSGLDGNFTREEHKHNTQSFSC